MYSTDHHFPGIVYAGPATAAIANGQDRGWIHLSPKRCPVCARFFIGRISAGSFVQRRGKVSKESVTSAARRSMTMSFVTMANHRG